MLKGKFYTGLFFVTSKIRTHLEGLTFFARGLIEKRVTHRIKDRGFTAPSLTRDQKQRCLLKAGKINGLIHIRSKIFEF